MLRGIPGFLPPELLKWMMEMGHGDEIALADRNFPAVSKARRLVRCDGITIVPLLEAIVPLLPLDEAMDFNTVLMKVPEALGGPVPQVWESYHRVLENSPDHCTEPLLLEKPEFYARSESAFAVVITGETARFANLILRKGIVRADEQ